MSDDSLDATVPLPPSVFHSLGNGEGSGVYGPPGQGLERYHLEVPFYRSLMSEVGNGFDVMLERDIVWKAPLSSTGPLLKAFITETRLSARLNHPHILAIHDLILLPDNRPVAILPRVDGVTLGSLLDAGDDGDLAVPSRLMLLMIFQQACLALDHAHRQGVVHCDVKPANILYRPPGQAYVADWGLAEDMRLQGSDGLTLPGRPTHGGIKGTLAYAAPEQLRGEWPTAAVDIHGLGALLYHLLTGVAPYAPRPGEDATSLLMRRLKQPLLRPREKAPSREIPLDLEALCLSCLQVNPEARPASALVVHDALAAYLEGLRLNAHRRTAADAILARAEQGRLRLAGLRREIEAERHELERAHAEHEAPGTRAERQAMWAIEDRAEALEREHNDCFLDVTNLLQQALELDADQVEARRALVAMYIDRLDELEKLGNTTEQALLEPLIHRYDERSPGLASSLAHGARAAVTLQTDPPAEVLRYRVVEEARILRAIEETSLGQSPVEVSLEPGRWLLLVRRQGYLEARFPLRVRRGERLQLSSRLLEAGALPEGFRFVPNGPAQLGGDLEAFVEESLEVYVPAFAIARHPVTTREYLEFINALFVRDREEARRRAPRSPAGAPRWIEEADGFRLPEIDPTGDPVSPELPVNFVSALDAEAWCAWRSERDGLPLRLPTPVEWEKAARGGDGRFLPWGDRFEASFCNNRESRPGRARLDPVGSYPEDTSPYGVMDLAGGVSDLTAGGPQERRRVCGGAWFVFSRQCRPARRVELSPDQVHPSVGFRVCFSVEA